MAADKLEESNVKIGLTGLAIGLVWLFIVGAFAFWLGS